MTEQTHSIIESQQGADARTLASATISLREKARQQAKVTFILAVIVPTLLVALKLAWEPATPGTVLYAIVMLLVFTLVLDRSRTAVLTAAARALEKYDCEVLALPWNGKVAGEEPSLEALAEVSAVATPTPSPEDAIDLYPAEVDQLPLAYGRVAGQSWLAAWNGEAAERYTSRLWTLAAGLAVVALGVGAVLRPTLETALTTVIALVPMVYWILRQQRGYRTAGQLASRVGQRVESAWRNAMAETIQGTALDSVARGIQDDIFVFRAAKPVTPRWAWRRFWQASPTDRPNFEQFREDYARLADGRR